MLLALANAFDDTEVGLSGEVADGSSGLDAVEGDAEVTRTTIHHLDGDTDERQVELLGDGVAAVYEHGIDQPAVSRFKRRRRSGPPRQWPTLCEGA